MESFNARLRDELLDGEIFYALPEAKIIIESWHRHYNTVRPHGSIGFKPPAPEVFIPATPRPILLTFTLGHSVGADQQAALRFSISVKDAS
ncbi:hypothetical protein BFX40_13520 [Mesorhizobium sp. SEMIA 3007]|nr:hypothetical protein BFX40_13520 [Mesorhizobium sp. SEMIA 3007]